jgi:hypothetical protein
MRTGTNGKGLIDWPCRGDGEARESHMLRVLQRPTNDRLWVRAGRVVDIGLQRMGSRGNACVNGRRFESANQSSHHTGLTEDRACLQVTGSLPYKQCFSFFSSSTVQYGTSKSISTTLYLVVLYFAKERVLKSSAPAQ